MANVNVKIAMDNRVKPGQITRDEVLAALRARGVDAMAAEPTWDPITGELIQTFVNLPDTAAEQATQVINANDGVSIAVVIPDPLTSSTVVGTAQGNGPFVGMQALRSGPQIYGQLCGENIQLCTLMTSLPGAQSQCFLGKLGGNGTINDWVAQNTTNQYPEANGTQIWIWNANQGPESTLQKRNLVFAANSFKLQVNGVTYSAVHNQFTVPAQAGGDPWWGPSFMALWAGLNPDVPNSIKLYPCYYRVYPNILIPQLTYRDAVIRGAL